MKITFQGYFYMEFMSYFKNQPIYRCEVQEMRRLNFFFEIF